MHFIPIKVFFYKNRQVIKKKKKFDQEGLQTAAFQQSFSQCWWKNPILEGLLIQKPT